MGPSLLLLGSSKKDSKWSFIGFTFTKKTKQWTISTSFFIHYHDVNYYLHQLSKHCWKWLPCIGCMVQTSQIVTISLEKFRLSATLFKFHSWPSTYNIFLCIARKLKMSAMEYFKFSTERMRSSWCVSTTGVL